MTMQRLPRIVPPWLVVAVAGAGFSVTGCASDLNSVYENVDRRRAKDGRYDVYRDSVGSQRRSVRLSGIVECSGGNSSGDTIAFVTRINSLLASRGNIFEVVVIDKRTVEEMGRWPLVPAEAKLPYSPSEDLWMERPDSIGVTDCRKIVAVSYIKNIRLARSPVISLWEVATGKLLGELALPSLGPDSQRIVARYPYYYVRHVYELVFSSDRKFLTARVGWTWDLKAESVPERPPQTVVTYDVSDIKAK